MPAADLYRSLWRNRLLILVLTIVAGVAAYGVTQTQTKLYEASALIRVQQRIATAGDAFGSLEVGQRLAQTYAKIVETRSMERRVAAQLLNAVPAEEISISASPVGDVELLNVTATSSSPVNAARVANATTAALVEFVSETGTLRDQIVVIDRATVPDTPSSPRVMLTVALVTVIAVLFNCALALVYDLYADRLPPVDEFEETFGRPLLGTVPSISFKPWAAGGTVSRPPRAPGLERPTVSSSAGAGSWPSAEVVPPRAQRGSRG